MTVVRPRVGAIGATLAVIASLLASLAVVSSPGPATAAGRVEPGAYRGTLLDDEGKPSPKEWVRFRVDDRHRVIEFRTRVWLHCYLYPNSYYQLPFVVEMPKARIDGRRVDKSWTEQITLEDGVETLEGRVQLTFRANGGVRGRVSIDVANCASRLGDPPYWVPLRAHRR